MTYHIKSEPKDKELIETFFTLVWARKRNLAA
jgi:hypothetical protein